MVVFKGVDDYRLEEYAGVRVIYVGFALGGAK